MSQKETSPLAHFVRNSLPHKSFRFCSPMLERYPISVKNYLENHRCQKPETIRSQKETSPLAHFVRNSLPHKSFRFCSPMLEWNQGMKPNTETIRSQKETSPLAHFVRNSLPHKSFRFCSPMLLWKPRSENQDLETIISQKETSPLAHFVRNSLPHKSFRFCSPMLKMEPINEPLDDDRLMVDRPRKHYIV